MPRLNIFAKGNLDVRDALMGSRANGAMVWNGVNETIRARHPQWLARVRHELHTRHDALAVADGNPPLELQRQPLSLEPYSLSMQCSTALYEVEADAIVLSIQSDVMNALTRHRQTGFLFFPANWPDWPSRDQDWLRANFEPPQFLEPAEAIDHLAAVVNRLRSRTQTPILVFNMSSFVPGEAIRCHAGLEEAVSTRIRRFNLGLIELSQKTGIWIVDLDAIVARVGAARLMIDGLHLNGEANRLVAEEIVDILDILGCFSP